MRGISLRFFILVFFFIVKCYNKKNSECSNPFLRHNHMQAVFVSEERAVAEAKMSPELRNSTTDGIIEAEAVYIKCGRTITMCRAYVREQGSDKNLAEGEFSF